MMQVLWPKQALPARGDCKQVVDALAASQRKQRQFIKEGGVHAATLAAICRSTSASGHAISMEKVKAHVNVDDLPPDAEEERAAAIANEAADLAAKQ